MVEHFDRRYTDKGELPDPVRDLKGVVVADRLDEEDCDRRETDLLAFREAVKGVSSAFSGLGRVPVEIQENEIVEAIEGRDREGFIATCQRVFEEMKVDFAGELKEDFLHFFDRSVLDDNDLTHSVHGGGVCF